MATEVASTWSVLGSEFAQPGRAIADRSATSDIGEVVKLLHRLKIQGRVLAYGTFGWTANIIRNARASNEAGQVAYRTAGRGDFWWRGSRLRYRMHFYCKNVDAKVTINGASTTAILGGSSLGWVMGSTVTYTSLTPGADGEVSFVLEVREGATSGDRLWYAFALEAVEDTEYGDGDDYAGAFQQVDAAAYAPDRPLTGWLLSTIERNVRDLQRSKPRGVCHCYLEANATNTLDAVTHDRCLIGSVRAKCDGPYLVWAPPWATEVDVFVRCSSAVSGLTSTVSVLTDQDSPTLREAILDTGERAQSFLNTSPSLLKWTVPITAARAGWTPVRVWIVHQSEISGTPWGSYNVKVVESVGIPVVHTDAPDPGLPYDGPFGLCLAQDEPVADATLKGTTYILGVTSYMDFAAGLDTGWVTTGHDARLYCSPHPRESGLMTYTSELATASEPLTEYPMAVLRVYAVYAGARSGEPVLSSSEIRSAAQVGALPSGTRLQRAVAAINELVLFSTPQLASRTPGQRWLYGESNYRIGATPWTFIQCGHSTWLEVATWPVPPDLQLGGDLDVEELEAVFFVALFATKNRGDNDLYVEARLVCDGVTGDTFTIRLPQRSIRAHDLARGEWDAALAARTQCVQRSGSGKPYNHAYTQHTEWFSERMAQAADWYSTSHAIRVAAPTTPPTECRLEVRCDADSDPVLAILGGGLQASRRV